MSKSAKSISIISGSDGPTSIFLAGKGTDKNIFHNLQHELQNMKYKYKQKLVKKSIVAEPHTFKETIQYFLNKYDMKEVDNSYPLYDDSKRGMKFALAQREHMELLGKQPYGLRQEDFKNQETVHRWHDELNKWVEKAQKIVEELPPEVLSVDYHMYVLDIGEDGSLQIEVEMGRHIIQTQYSGNSKVMEPIIKDIFLYYGVSQDDINNNTERYQKLVMILMQ